MRTIEDATLTPAEEKYLPNPNRDGGLCLALSGGGFRATLFHLGALRRLNELHVLTSFRGISSVSGGSMISLCLADCMMKVPPVAGEPLANFDELVNSVVALTSFNLRRTIFLKKILPWNWLTSLPELVARELEDRITSKSLADLPTSPEFVFCATDLSFGIDWVYEKTRAGNDEAGYKYDGLDSISLGHATAASGCFPPLFKPMSSGVKKSEFRDGHATGTDADECRSRVRLTDGGVYDNMGLEPLWKNAETLIVSDAGGPFEYSHDRGTLADLKRYSDIMGNQARALRKRWLISSFLSSETTDTQPGLRGTYWATTSDRTRYDPSDTLGYSADVANMIARIRTDLDSFSDAEQAVLQNHGYLLADVAIKVHLPQLYASAPPMKVPFADWMDEGRVCGAIKDSARQHL